MSDPIRMTACGFLVVSARGAVVRIDGRSARPGVGRSPPRVYFTNGVAEAVLQTKAKAAGTKANVWRTGRVVPVRMTVAEEAWTIVWPLRGAALAAKLGGKGAGGG